MGSELLDHRQIRLEIGSIRVERIVEIDQQLDLGGGHQAQGLHHASGVTVTRLLWKVAWTPVSPRSSEVVQLMP